MKSRNANICLVTVSALLSLVTLEIGLRVTERLSKYTFSNFIGTAFLTKDFIFIIVRRRIGNLPKRMDGLSNTSGWRRVLDRGHSGQQMAH
jgi:hypothetical protein